MKKIGIVLILLGWFSHIVCDEASTATVENSKEANKAITQLMEEMSKQEEQFSNKKRIHFIDSLSVKEGSAEAEYLEKWSKKLEHVGNANYAQVLSDFRLSGRIGLNVTLDKMGHVVKTNISISSGSEILDDATLLFVKLADPFEPLPKEITEKYDQLNISRTLTFNKDKDKNKNSK